MGGIHREPVLSRSPGELPCLEIRGPAASLVLLEPLDAATLEQEPDTAARIVRAERALGLVEVLVGLVELAL